MAHDIQVAKHAISDIIPSIESCSLHTAYFGNRGLWIAKFIFISEGAALATHLLAVYSVTYTDPMHVYLFSFTLI